jgi:hypothetical protein
VNPIETIMNLLPFITDDELKAVADFIARRLRANKPATDKPKRYPYVFECAGCKCLVDSERSDAITCSPACRVTAHRNGYAKALRELARQSWLDVPPAMILQIKAASLLLPGAKKRLNSGEVKLDDLRSEIWLAYWALVKKAINDATS